MPFQVAYYFELVALEAANCVNHAPMTLCPSDRTFGQVGLALE